MTKLIFIYNADAGLGNAILDSLHKTFSPKTYPCKLCAITYGTVSMNKEWKTWLETGNFESIFLHKDEFVSSEYNRAIMLPAILIEKENTVKVAVGNRDFETINTLEDLIRHLELQL